MVLSLNPHEAKEIKQFFTAIENIALYQIKLVFFWKISMFLLKNRASYHWSGIKFEEFLRRWNASNYKLIIVVDLN